MQQKPNTQPIAKTLRDFEVGDSGTWPIERDVTVRNAASRIMLLDPSKEIVCNQCRKSRTITATRTR